MSKMSVASQPMKADPSHHCEELIERLDALRKNESFCDVTVVVKGKEFKAHKLVLAAASPFFLSLLESDMKESSEQLIRIELEEATPDVMKDVLKYIYTGTVPLTEERGHNLIATADYLLLQGLKTLAGNFMKENVTTDNCVFNYYFADKYQCFVLKEGAHEVITACFSVVVETDDFLNLETKQVMEWVSSDDVIVSAEEDIFKGIVKWVSHNRSERERHFLNLLHEVRLGSISNDFLFDELINNELITTNIDSVNFVLSFIKQIFKSTTESCCKPPRKCLEVHRDAIFVCGGRNALCYLPQTNEWNQLMNMTLEHQDHAVVQYRGKVHVFSKQKVVSGQSHIAEYYVPSTNSWGAIQTKFEYHEQFSSLLILDGDKNLFALTNCTETEPENTLFKYQLEKNTWEICGGKVLSRWGACGVTDGHHIYIMGGTDNGSKEINGLTTVRKINPSELYVCEEIAAMNEARHNAFGGAMNGKVYVAGGLQRTVLGFIVLKTCEVYNPLTDEWQIIPSLNVPRHSASMVNFRGTLYVVGGLKNKQKSRELSVEMFDSKENVWKAISTIPVNHEQQPGTRNIHYKACFATVHKNVLEESCGKAVVSPPRIVLPRIVL